MTGLASARPLVGLVVRPCDTEASSPLAAAIGIATDRGPHPPTGPARGRIDPSHTTSTVDDLTTAPGERVSTPSSLPLCGRV